MLVIASVLAIVLAKAAYYPMAKPAGTYIALCVMLLASLFLTFWSIRRTRAYRWAPSLIILGLYLATFASCIFAVVSRPQDALAVLAPFGSKAALSALVEALATAALEETIFREFIQQQLSSQFTERIAIVITAVLFYLMHFTFLPTPLLFGLAAGVLRAYSGNLVPSIALHTMTNAIGYLSAGPVSVANGRIWDGLTWSQLFSGSNSVSLTVAAIASLAIFTWKRPAGTALSRA